MHLLNEHHPFALGYPYQPSVRMQREKLSSHRRENPTAMTKALCATKLTLSDTPSWNERGLDTDPDLRPSMQGTE
jgi:hypothetical protein